MITDDVAANEDANRVPNSLETQQKLAMIIDDAAANEDAVNRVPNSTETQQKLKLMKIPEDQLLADEGKKDVEVIITDDVAANEDAANRMPNSMETEQKSMDKQHHQCKILKEDLEQSIQKIVDACLENHSQKYLNHHNDQNHNLPQDIPERLDGLESQFAELSYHRLAAESPRKSQDEMGNQGFAVSPRKSPRSSPPTIDEPAMDSRARERSPGNFGVLTIPGIAR